MSKQRDNAKKRWSATNEERFRAKYIVEGSGCWEWIGAKVGLTFNYGKFWLDGAYDKAHRAAYRLFVGPIPSGMWVLHTCDNPSCVNPAHLFTGTRQDNIDDMMSKGRNGHSKNPPRGDKRKDSKLTTEAVLDMRRRCSAGESQSAIATGYGVAQSTVSKVVNRQRWAHV